MNAKWKICTNDGRSNDEVVDDDNNILIPVIFVSFWVIPRV